MNGLGWPQVAMIVIMSLGLYKELIVHGMPETGKHNFWAYLIGTIIEVVILKCGGFF